MERISTAKPVAVVGTNGTIPRYSTLTSVDNFGRSGLNLGNLAFQHAVWTHLADEREVVPFNFVPGELRERYRLICIPSANYLYSAFDFADLAARLEATGLPLLVIGLGIQASRSLDEVVLQPGTQRLLALFAERCETIFVRGEMTGAFLESQGVRNFEALGCPSNFLSPNPNLGRAIGGQLAALGGDLPERVAFAPTFYPQTTQLEVALLREIGPALARIVVQEPLEGVALARGRRSLALRGWWERASGFVAALPEEERTPLLRLLAGYFSVEAWIEAYRRNDFVVGTRIHGVSLAWQAGRPAVLVGHDMRTRELAEAMGLPLMAPQEAAPPGLLARATVLAADRAAAYDARRHAMAARYVALLRRHGVHPSAELDLLAGYGDRPAGEARSQAEQNAALAAPAAPGRMGFLERYSRAAVSGWVRGATAEEAAVTVRFADEAPIELVPERPRPDAAQDAWHFTLAAPEHLHHRAEVPVSVRHAASGTHLANSPATARFGREQPGSVLVGRDGVLFLSDAASNALAQARGEVRLDEGQLAAWRDFLLGFDDAAASLAFTGHLLIAPGKEVVLGRFLPEGQAVSEDRPARQIEALARSLELKRVVVAYPLAELEAEPPGVAFPRGDTHWTGWSAVRALAGLWSSPLPPPGAPRYPADGEVWDPRYEPGDLLMMRGDTSVEPRRYPRRPRLRRVVSSVTTASLGRMRRFASTDPAAEGRAVLFHDWMGEALVDPMAEQFLLTTTIFGDTLDSELVEGAMPDTVVFEMAERFLLRAPRVV